MVVKYNQWIKLALQNFKEAGECLKFDKARKKYAFELEDSNYQNPKVDMLPFSEKLASALARFVQEIDECDTYHISDKTKKEYVDRLRCCINMLLDDEGVKKAILHANTEYDGKTLRLCDIVFSFDHFEELSKIYETRITNALKNLDKFDETSVQRIKRAVIKQFRHSCVDRLRKILEGCEEDIEEETGRIEMTPMQRIDFALLELENFEPINENVYPELKDFLTDELVKDSSLDIDVTKVPFENVNKYDEKNDKKNDEKKIDRF